MKRIVKILIYSLAVFIGIFGMGQLNILADDSQTNESTSESVKDSDATPQQWGDATWYVKDNVLYLGGTAIPEYVDSSPDQYLIDILPWMKDYENTITKIVIAPEVGKKLKLPTDSTGLFAELPKLKEIEGLDKLDVSQVTTFFGMFEEDSSLINLDLSSFKVSEGVSKLDEMFKNDTSLQTIDISPFNGGSCENMLLNLPSLYQIKMSNLDLKDSGYGLESNEDSGDTKVLQPEREWINTSSKESSDPVKYPQPSENVSTWNVKVFDGMPEPFFVGFANKDIKLEDKRITNHKIDQTQSKDDQNTYYPLVFSVPNNEFEYFGQSIDIDIPEVDGYTGPKQLKVTLIIPMNLPETQNYLQSLNNGEFSSDYVMLQAASTGKTFTMSDVENSETFDYSIYYTKDKPAVKPITPSTHHTSTSTTIPTVTSKYTHKLQTLTAYPDRLAANIYDEDGNLSKTVALSPDSNWQTDEYMTIKGEKYYRVATNEFVKASDIYLYKDKDSVVRTHDGADYISLDNSHGDTVTNRALAVKTDWKIDKVIKINNEDYYRVATNEFVKADNVDVIK